MLMPDKEDLETRSNVRGMARKCHEDERVISSEHKNHTRICLNNRASKYVKQKVTELKGK